MAVSFKEFRDRFPHANVLSDLLMVHGEQFVVKVVIEVPDGGTASGLSAHAELEIAEDQARQRALLALGVGDYDERSPAPPTVSPLLAGDEPGDDEPFDQPEKPAKPTARFQSASKPNPKPPKVDIAPTTPKAYSNGRSQSDQAEFDGNPHEFAPPSSDTALTGSSVQPQTAASQAGATVRLVEAEALPTEQPDTSNNHPAEAIAASALPPPINLSDVIAQTDIELRRLGWSVETGREYLESTYDKRSRHELTEEELIQFLCHLESLPD